MGGSDGSVLAAVGEGSRYGIEIDSKDNHSTLKAEIDIIGLYELSDEEFEIVEGKTHY